MKLSAFWCYEVSLINGVWKRREDGNALGKGFGVRALRKEASITPGLLVEHL